MADEAGRRACARAGHEGLFTVVELPDGALVIQCARCGHVDMAATRQMRQVYDALLRQPGIVVLDHDGRPLPVPPDEQDGQVVSFDRARLRRDRPPE